MVLHLFCHKIQDGWNRLDILILEVLFYKVFCQILEWVLHLIAKGPAYGYILPEKIFCVKNWCVCEITVTIWLLLYSMTINM